MRDLLPDFLLHRIEGGVELIPRSHLARMFMEGHRLDGVVVSQWTLTEEQWPAFEAAIQSKGLTIEEAS